MVDKIGDEDVVKRRERKHKAIFLRKIFEKY